MTTLSPGDQVIYPGLGLSTVKGIQSIDLGDEPQKMVVLCALDRGVTVSVPPERLAELGVRQIMNQSLLVRVRQTLSKPLVLPSKLPTWNRRFRDYNEKIMAGDPLSLSEVLRELHQISTRKTLSFGERRLYDNVRRLLREEIAAVSSIDDTAADEVIDSCLQAA